MAASYNDPMGALSLNRDHLTGPVRKPADSGVRLVVVDDEAIRVLSERQCAVSERIANAVSGLPRSSYDPSVNAALKTVAARLSDVADVRDALDDVLATMWLAHAQPYVRSALVTYLEGVQRWVLAVVEELMSLANDLIKMSVDWSKVRFRLALAQAEWPTELVSEMRDDLLRLEQSELTDTVDDLVFVLHVLDANLAQRFG